MKILIIADEVWNDRINGNNVLTNWFQGFQAEFAEVFATPGIPYNQICKYYFQITDGEMIRSVFSNTKAGKILNGDFSEAHDTSGYNSTDVKHLGFFRNHLGNLLRLMKTIVWNFGRIDEDRFKQFIEEYKPDILFSARYSHSKIIRLEKLALKYSNCPIVAFTGDNELSLRRFSFSPIFWSNLLYQRRCLKKMMPHYSLYYTLSERQIQEYQKHFNIPMRVLRKCSPRPMGEMINRDIGQPIKIVYGGKLYAGRDATMLALAEAIKQVNSNHICYELHIYTGSQLSEKKYKELNDEKNTFIHKPVSAELLEEVYHNSDIALSVESFQLSQRLETRLSFSTKLIDCLYSTCAVMMIGWPENSGYEYLEKEKAAICIGSIDRIYPTLISLVNSPEMLQDYRENAYKCMKENHDRKMIQDGILADFSRIIENHKQR